MWISNRRHVYRVCGIILHPTGVFSNVLMQNKRHGIDKHLIGQKLLFGTWNQQRYLRFLIKLRQIVHIEPSGHVSNIESGICYKEWRVLNLNAETSTCGNSENI